MVHGFSQSAVSMYTLYKPLMEHYRIVAIDMLGFGSSSRVSLSPEMYNSVEDIDEYQVGWFEKWVNKMTELGELPEKFFLHGHSYGGYLSALFASRNPERITALFLNSPVGAEPIPKDYDPLKIRLLST